MLRVATAGLIVTSFIGGSVSLARGGDEDNRPGRAARGTAAWFVHETGENEVEALLATGQLKQEEVSGVFVKLTAADTSEVVIASDSGQIMDTCAMVDHASRRGTVMKKEVFCGNSPYYAPELRAARGSKAWIALESIEHVVRAAIIKTPAIESTITSGESVVAQDGKSATVTIGLADGTSSAYLCTVYITSSQGGTIQKADLRCPAQ
jgi:hypothetical protein